MKGERGIKSSEGLAGMRRKRKSISRGRKLDRLIFLVGGRKKFLLLSVLPGKEEEDSIEELDKDDQGKENSTTGRQEEGIPRRTY